MTVLNDLDHFQLRWTSSIVFRRLARSALRQKVQLQNKLAENGNILNAMARTFRKSATENGMRATRKVLSSRRKPVCSVQAQWFPACDGMTDGN
jgi:hypothetical protein